MITLSITVLIEQTWASKHKEAFPVHFFMSIHTSLSTAVVIDLRILMVDS